VTFKLTQIDWCSCHSKCHNIWSSSS